MALKDIQKDSRLYSGWNRYKVITADLAPVIFGTALGSGGVAFGMPAVFGLVGGVLGDYEKEYIKAEKVRKDVYKRQDSSCPFTAERISSVKMTI